MIRRIIPAIIAKNQRELDKRIKKVSKHTKFFQLDVMDGKFVKNKSLMFDFKVPKGNYEAHLMVKNPEEWIEKHGKKVNTIIFHFESSKNHKEIMSLIRKKKKKVGISINPRTSITKLKPFLKQIDMVLVMTVNPGKYGSKFLPNALRKVRALRKSNPKLNIEVDGGISDKTISLASKSGANSFVSGSYLQKSKDVKKSFEMLKVNLINR